MKSGQGERNTNDFTSFKRNKVFSAIVIHL